MTRPLDNVTLMRKTPAQVIGAVAQLGERIVRNDKVRGSIPLCSTNDLLTGNSAS